MTSSLRASTIIRYSRAIQATTKHPVAPRYAQFNRAYATQIGTEKAGSQGAKLVRVSNST